MSFLSPVLRLVRLFAFFLVLVWGSAGGALAQQPLGKDGKPLIDGLRAELSQVEAALTRERLDDARLADLRERLEPVISQIEELISREQPHLDEVKARIERLGPAPDPAKGGAAESEDVASERREQAKRLREVDEGLKIYRAMALRAEQAKSAIAERRRQNFSREILSKSSSILSPLLWYDAARALPAEFRAARVLLSQWGDVLAAKMSWLKGIVLLALGLAAVVFAPYLKAWIRTGSFRATEIREDVELPRLSRALIALRTALFSALAPIMFFMALQLLLEGFELVLGRGQPVLENLMSGLAFVFAVNGLAVGLLAPDQPRVRLVALPDVMAREIWQLLRLLAVLIVIGQLLEAFHAAIVAALPVTIVSKGVFALIVSVVLANGLRRIFRPAPDGNAEHAAALSALLPLRLFGWGVLVCILGAALSGYVAFASFLLGQIVWLTVLGLVMLLLLVLVEEFIGRGMSSKGEMGRRLREITGLAANSLDQIAVLSSGFARLLVYVVLVMLALAPWGIDSSNFVGNLKAAFFGFQVGGVTISLSTIALAVLFFALGLAATRAVQNWLDTRYLPHTGLDLGLRNSIRTIFGYVGTIIATMVALSQVGLSMEKLTLVAGALSVGIGFGLKSIVENFVSGLILLWERPIRVGDWIVVGTEQGKVKRINVRSTEIETFDRASLIIPNAEFISGRVKNWTHADHMARIIIPLTVDTTCDPEQVQTLLKDAALAHREVLTEPGPSVIFKNLGENGLEFELRCYVDVDSLSSTRSELLFDIFARLRAAKIEVPTPTRRLEITNLASMVEQGAFVPGRQVPGEGGIGREA